MKTKILLALFSMVYLANMYSQKIEKTQHGIKTVIDHLNYEVTFYSPSIVRILKNPVEKKMEKESFSVIKKPGNVSINMVEQEGEIMLTSAKMKVIIDKKTGKTAFLSPDGNVLLTEKEYGSQFTPIKDVNEDSYLVRQAFKLDRDEAIYGLGQFQDGKMSMRDQKVELLQKILITAIPFFQSTKGYGLFWENYSPTYFTDNPYETSFESSVGDCADYYFMVGGNADGVIAQMRDLTGQAPMFPYWTYGYWQSKERYKSQDETVGVVKKYRELGVPLDGIIQDWQYWSTDNYYWNDMEFGNPEFPDPQKMIDDVHDMNAHMIISIWSSFGPKTEQYEELNARNMLLDFKTWPLWAENIWPTPPDAKPSGVKVYDAYNPKARDIYWKHLNDGIFKLGMDGWWMDSTEPDHFNIKDNDYNNMTYLGSFRKYRNLYPLMTVGGVYTHQREVASDKRVFILTRSAFAGQQRYGANAWSGDVVSDWPEFKNQIAAGLNFSLCGIPHWNSDIGGFFVWRYPERIKNPAYKELYVRWLQFGTFCPMMRSHGTDTPREIYQFGEKGSWAYDAIEKFINLRYRLLPYIYSVSWDVTNNASSMMRALMMDFAHDKKVLDINDQYMFGKSMLVCPVTEAQYTKNDKSLPPADFSQVKSRELYLPAGASWYDFWTNEKFDGGQEITRKTPVDLMPLYIKAGTILPMGPFVQYANEKKGTLEIRVYPGADGEFVFYDDERDNYNYENGMYATIKFNWDDKAKTLIIGERNGSFKGMSKNLTLNISVMDQTMTAGLNSTEHYKQVKYTGKEMRLKL